jgi:hypothetical protein
MKISVPSPEILMKGMQTVVPLEKAKNKARNQ